MVSFRQKFLVVAMAVGLSVSVFGQKGSDNSNKRPPKVDTPQVVVKEKDKRPPQPEPKGKDKP